MRKRLTARLTLKRAPAPAAGFQAHAAKPLEAAKLIEIIAKLVEAGGKRRGP